MLNVNPNLFPDIEVFEYFDPSDGIKVAGNWERFANSTECATWFDAPNNYNPENPVSHETN